MKSDLITEQQEVRKGKFSLISEKIVRTHRFLIFVLLSGNNELTNTGRILICQNEKGDTKIDVFFDGDTIWTSRRTMTELYQVDVREINKHISDIYADGELDKNRTIRNFRIVRTEGTLQVNREIKHYNLDMILAVGYCVRNHVGAHFRKWASSVLTEYKKKGFALNDERLKKPKVFGADYFDELLECIRNIRDSEKRIYQKVKDIFALSVDYDSRIKLCFLP